METGRCRCNTGMETARHVVEECPLEERLSLGEHPNLRWLLTDPQTTATVTRWMIRTGRLKQFALAGELLYGER